MDAEKAWNLEFTYAKESMEKLKDSIVSHGEIMFKKGYKAALKSGTQPTTTNKQSTQVLCGCGDHIDLLGNRDYTYTDGKYYCVECMRS